MPSTELALSKDEDEEVQDGETHVDDSPSADPTDENVLVNPKPKIGLTNALFKSVHESTPPTPGDSSPLRVAIDKIYPSKVDDDDLFTSPTERKEGEVQLPTRVCEFASNAEKDGEAESNTKGKAVLSKEN